MHGALVPLCLTAFYLTSLPVLKWVTNHVLVPRYDMEVLLMGRMILYNLAQVGLNGWMVVVMVDPVVYRGHPFIGSRDMVGVAVNS